MQALQPGSIPKQVRQRAQQVAPIFAKAKKAEEDAEPEAAAKLMFKKGSTHKASLRTVHALIDQAAIIIQLPFVLCTLPESLAVQARRRSLPLSSVAQG